MDWKKIAPWNWFKEEEPSKPVALAPAEFDASRDPFAALRTEMSRYFDEAFHRSFSGFPALHAGADLAPSLLRPSVDISEGKKAYTIRAELPGVEMGDVSIEVEDQTLVIRAEKRRESEDDDEGYHCVERSYGALQRVLSLPDDADPEAIDARFKNGVLELRIPKHAAKTKSGRQIEIQSG
jgi:HSP20 family protein